MHTQPKSIPKRILGIDYGMKRIGLALSDETQMLATPYKVLQAEGKSEKTAVKLLALIAEITKEYRCEIQEIVIGLPLMMNGSTGLLADEVRHFVELLRRDSPIPIHTWDERLTSVQADRALREGNFTRKKRAQYVDTVSAVIILQNYLDAKSAAR